MKSLNFAGCDTAVEASIREDIRRAHTQAWQRLASPGSRWTGAERVAIAAETRAAEACAHCSASEAALSPFSIDGEHERASQLPEAVVDAVHRVVRDSARLTKSWVEKLGSKGIDDARYVELVGIVVTVLSIDRFCTGIGASLHPLPEPLAGEAEGQRPEGLRELGAFVPMLAKASGANSDLWTGPMPNVIRALSLVPDAVRQLNELSDAYYLPQSVIPQPGYAPGRGIDRVQIEMIAARVSALNECFY